MPLLGAYIADTYWGRFKTIQVSCFISILGHIILVISAIPPVIVHPNGAIACFSIGIVIMGMGYVQEPLFHVMFMQRSLLTISEVSVASNQTFRLLLQNSAQRIASQSRPSLQERELSWTL